MFDSYTNIFSCFLFVVSQATLLKSFDSHLLLSISIVKEDGARSFLYFKGLPLFWSISYSWLHIDETEWFKWIFEDFNSILVPSCEVKNSY